MKTRHIKPSEHLELLKGEWMAIFKIDREVTQVDGHQTFSTEAETKEEALKKFKAGDDLLWEECLDVQNLEEPTIDGIYQD